MQSLNVNIFDSLKHYYVKKIILIYLSKLNISKSEFIVLYERTRMLDFEVKNIINA
jgi:hypothetical protein